MSKLINNILDSGSIFSTIEHSNGMYTDTNEFIKNCNCCNNSHIMNIDVPKEDKDKIKALEESIRFLRSEHTVMLKKLHEEVDELRRTNKDLQFKLVMCCCSREAQNIRDKSCVRSIEDINGEADELRRLLSEERMKSKYAFQQLEAFKEAQRTAFDPKDVLGIPVERNFIKGAENARHQVSGAPQDTNAIQNGIAVKEKNTLAEKPRLDMTAAKEHGAINALAYAQPKTSVKKRITSPDLNQDSQSSAILLTPNTNMPTPDGFWVRPSVAGLKNTTLPTGTRESLILNKHIIPVKLPIVHQPDSTPYAGRLSKELLTARLTGHHVIPDKNSSSFIQDHRTDKQGRLISSAHSARNTLGHNTIANYNLSTLRTPKLKSYSRSTGFISSPFLPAIPKSLGLDRTGDQPTVHRKLPPHEVHRRRSTRINTHTQLQNNK